MKAAKFALRCFYRDCLQVSGWTVFEEVRIAEPQVLPLVLSRQEVQAVLAAVREPRFRAALRLMYHCGLRVGETVGIQVQDIHGRETPPRLHIRNGKGGNYAKVVVMQRYVTGILRRRGRTHDQLSITTGFQGSEDPLHPDGIDTAWLAVDLLLPMPASSSPSWPRHRDGSFGDFHDRGKGQ